jgi:hypothetical protein
MTTLNYFLIGTSFAFFIELLFNKFVSHPLLKGTKWGWFERIILILIWPIGVLVFLGAFINNFKK